MAITESDILVMASERLTDDTDGGGRMSATVVQSGVENNLFNDVSSVDRAEGALHIRKAFAWVNSTGHEPLLGAHVILDDLADDLDVTAVIIPATGPADTRAQLIAHLNTPDAASTLPFYGTKTLQADAAIGERTVQVDGIETQFIPLGRFSEAVSGAVEVRTVTGLKSVGGTVDLTETVTDAATGSTATYVNVGVDSQILKSVRAVPGGLSVTLNTWDTALTDGSGGPYGPDSTNPVVITTSAATGLVTNDKDVPDSGEYLVIIDAFTRAVSNDGVFPLSVGTVFAVGRSPTPRPMRGMG